MWSPEVKKSLEELKKTGGKRFEIAVASLQMRIKELDEKIQDLVNQVCSAQNGAAYCREIGSMRVAQLYETSCQMKSFRLKTLKQERLTLYNCMEFLTL